ncbi:D-serine ammonia-lyase [Clostridiaceae bacterium 35-E11]
MVAGRTIAQWIDAFPLMKEIIKTQVVFWTNPRYQLFEEAMQNISLSEIHIKEAEERLQRFAPYIKKVFPETHNTNGIIESSIVQIPTMQKYTAQQFQQQFPGQWLLKCDNHLPIAGSIKARGGIYEVLKHAEALALKNHMLATTDDYSILASEKFRSFFSQYSIAVGSTGNLGLSIGIISAKMGFKVTVHMSADAKQWKKDLLRSKGVEVVEYASDYSKAVAAGRKQSSEDPNSYFIDDENSTNLFLGYAVAAYRLKKQLADMRIPVDKDHPLFVYLPCGVGGGPGGVAFGLKLIYKDNVHCFFAEPTHSPCMLIGMLTEQHDKVCVQDFGIDNITEADGLAVGRPSGFVGKTLTPLLSGIYTVEDADLYRLLRALADTENIFLEPSALASLLGPIQLFKSTSGQKYLADHHLKEKLQNATHISWATGGSLVPKEVMDLYYQKDFTMKSSSIY